MFDNTQIYSYNSTNLKSNSTYSINLVYNNYRDNYKQIII